MRNYDFKSLSDKDFEILVCDLLSAEHQIRFERFKQGKDGGIDSRYFSADGDQVIIQCKHWARSGVAALIKSLKNSESDKVKALKPKRYILATSLELSAKNKADIAAIFSPWMLSESDIYGNEDINDLLGKYEQIERQHYKLWISSTGVIESILHNAILGRSDFAVNEIVEKSPRYVATSAHKSAENKLNEKGVIIITGEPGIGKTTLAEQLCLIYTQNGYQLAVIGESIEEAEAVFSKDKQQIFYFDDFLGRNYLNALNRHEDSHIVSFISRIKKDKSKKFILTSRTNILNQGKRLSDTFEIANLSQSEFEVLVTELRPIDKALILYNHIWFSNLGIEYIEEVLHNKRYRDVVNHKNFNPRLISFITDPQRLNGVPHEKYWDYIQEKLTNPAAVWQHTYESQLDDFSRAIVLTTVLNDGKISETDLSRAYYELFNCPLLANGTGNNDFEINTRLLTGSILNRHILKSDTVFTLFNPSVADYVINREKNNQHALINVLLCLRTNSGLDNLSALIEDKIISTTTTNLCLEKLIQEHIPDADNKIHPHYKIKLCEIALTLASITETGRSTISDFIKKLSTAEISQCDAIRGVGVIIKTLIEKETLSAQSAVEILANIPPDYIDPTNIPSLSPICTLLPTEEQQKFAHQLKKSAVDYWEDCVDQEIRESDVIGGYYDNDDADLAYSDVFDYIKTSLAKLGLPFSDTEISLIAARCDIDEIISDNIVREAKGYSNDDYRDYSRTAIDDGIDDIFVIDFPSN